MEASREGQPRAIYHPRRLRVTAIRDRWRIDDEWWRDEISRFYYQAVLEDGRCFTLYQDLITQKWFQQRY